MSKNIPVKSTTTELLGVQKCRLIQPQQMIGVKDMPVESTATTVRFNDDDGVERNVLGCRVDILGTNCVQCVSMVQCCFTSTETVRLVRTGSPGRPPRLSHSS